MQTGTARALLILMTPAWLTGCGPPEAAVAVTAPAAHAAPGKSDKDIRREQRALERRRLKLQKQLLSELRKLRESRQASTGAAEPAHEGAQTSAEALKLMVFGGSNHEVFLGCLCEEREADSVFNMMGEHGSELSETSIRNKFAPYGSDHDDTSACNPSATRPPTVLTSDGKSLGLLTRNPSLKRRIDVPAVADWLARMCGE